MLPGTYLGPPLRARGTVHGFLGEITDAQRAADAEARQAALQYAMEDRKSAREDAARAQERAEARQAETEATARMERAQQQAIDAAMSATEAAALTQRGILITSKSSLNKVLVTVGLGLIASYVMFAKTLKRTSRGAGQERAS